MEEHCYCCSRRNRQSAFYRLRGRRRSVTRYFNWARRWISATWYLTQIVLTKVDKLHYFCNFFIERYIKEGNNVKIYNLQLSDRNQDIRCTAAQVREDSDNNPVVVKVVTIDVYCKINFCTVPVKDSVNF